MRKYLINLRKDIVDGFSAGMLYNMKVCDQKWLMDEMSYRLFSDKYIKDMLSMNIGEIARFDQSQDESHTNSQVHYLTIYRIS